jgi:hypothetical protein
VISMADQAVSVPVLRLVPALVLTPKGEAALDIAELTDRDPAAAMPRSVAAGAAELARQRGSHQLAGDASASL